MKNRVHSHARWPANLTTAEELARVDLAFVEIMRASYGDDESLHRIALAANNRLGQIAAQRVNRKKTT